MLIAPVTPQLLAAMVKAHDAVKAYDAPDRKRSDKTLYSPTVDVLETLTVAVLSATSALSLIKVNPVGARFNMADGSIVASHASVCVKYLRNDATELLGLNDFNKYDLVQTGTAMDLLKGMYYLLSNAIAHMVREDLTAIELSGPERLVHTAEVMSSVATNQSA